MPRTEDNLIASARRFSRQLGHGVVVDRAGSGSLLVDLGISFPG